MMLSRLSFIFALAVALAFFGCSSDDENSNPATGGSAGASGSGGSGGGSSGTGGGGTGGSTDKCAADDTNAASTFGCNGAKPGPQADNALGGKCTPDGSDGQGTCSSSDQICDSYEVALGGICVIECTPGATYVSTGGCPTGYRCYDFTTVAYCYPDCESEADCGTGVCDEDSACSSPIPVGDGGVTDGGVTDGGVTDGGIGDASAD